MFKFLGKKKVKDASLSPFPTSSMQDIVMLQQASYAGDVAVVKKLVKQGVDINCVDKDNRSPLYFSILSTCLIRQICSRIRSCLHSSHSDTKDDTVLSLS